jgi:sRNA-binding protein
VPKPQLISDAERTFLIGKPAGFTIDQVSKAARDSQFEDQQRAVEERRRQKQREKAGEGAARAAKPAG